MSIELFRPSLKPAVINWALMEENGKIIAIHKIKKKEFFIKRN